MQSLLLSNLYEEISGVVEGFFCKPFKYPISAVWETFLIFKFRQPILYLRNHSLLPQKVEELQLPSHSWKLVWLKWITGHFFYSHRKWACETVTCSFLPVFHFTNVWQRILYLCSVGLKQVFIIVVLLPFTLYGEHLWKNPPQQELLTADQ